MLIGSFAFASNVVNTEKKDVPIQEITFEKDLNYHNLSSIDYVEVESGEDLLECRLKIKGTINGQPVDIDITFTSDSGSCIKDSIKFLKELAAEM